MKKKELKELKEKGSLINESKLMIIGPIFLIKIKYITTKFSFIVIKKL